MIGVALVVFAAIFASSATKSVNDALDQTYVGDLTITNVDGFSPFSPEVGDRGRGGRRGRDRLRRSRARRRGSSCRAGRATEIINGLDADLPAGREARLDRRRRLDARVGSGRTRRSPRRSGREDNGIEVGDELTLTIAGRRRSSTVTIVGNGPRPGPACSSRRSACRSRRSASDFDAEPGLRRPDRLRRRRRLRGHPGRRRRAGRGPLPAGRRRSIRRAQGGAGGRDQPAARRSSTCCSRSR